MTCHDLVSPRLSIYRVPNFGRAGKECLRTFSPQKLFPRSTQILTVCHLEHDQARGIEGYSWYAVTVVL